MAMNAGSVSVSGGGVVSGTGLAREIFDAVWAGRVAGGLIPTAPTLGGTSPPWSAERPVSADDVTAFNAQIVSAKQQVAIDANAMASAIVTHLTTNGRARVVSESLGRVPTPNTSGTAIDAPASPVEIALV